LFVRDDNDLLRQSFGTIAERYDRFRPGPPDEAVQRALPPEAIDVLELGAGTGGLTRRLVLRFPHVRAVEPDSRMRAVLLERVPQADVVAGSAEEIPAENSSFDAVVGASMWHWVDEERALPEVARVLRPGGSFSLLWNGVDRSVDWVRSLWAGGKELDREEKVGEDARRRARHEVHPGAAGGLFLEPERQVIRWTRAMPKEDLVGMAGTYSAVITMDAVERREYLASIARFLETHDIPLGGDAIEVPMRCICWRTSLR
jgi:SAM-dependent methyltransferase